MTKMRFMLNALAVFSVCVLCSSLAQAQATRTWVSGVGDDANPCSRTAPCKTFAGAISKTAACGEISVLDPGGFGGVTITKSITISGDGTLAGILVTAGSNGVIVNAGVNDVVILRSISINGACTGGNGIRYLAGRSLRVENCTIYGFTTNGIDAFHTTSDATKRGELTVENTSITNVGGVGIRVAQNGGLASPTAQIDHVRINKAAFGVDAQGSSIVTVANSAIAYVTNQAVVAENTSTANVTSSVLTNNGTGVAAFTSGATIRIANNDIFNNATGVSVVTGGVCDRFSNNRVFGNTTAQFGGAGVCNPQINQ